MFFLCCYVITITFINIGWDYIKNNNKKIAYTISNMHIYLFYFLKVWNLNIFIHTIDHNYHTSGFYILFLSDFSEQPRAYTRNLYLTKYFYLIIFSVIFKKLYYYLNLIMIVKFEKSC